MTESAPHLAVDLSGFQNENIPPTHLRYTVEFLRALDRNLPTDHLMTIADWRKRLPGVDPMTVGGTRLQRSPATLEALMEFPGLVYHVGRIDPASTAIPMRLISGGVPITVSVLSLPGRTTGRHPGKTIGEEALGAILRSFDLVLTPSEWVATSLKPRFGLGSDRIVEVGVGCTSAAPVLDLRFTQAVFGEGHPYVIVADAGEIEGLYSETLLRALARLPSRIRARTKAVLLGRLSAARQRTLRRLARELGVADNQLVLAGWLDPATLATYMRAAALFVHLAPDDGIGLAALEAAACGSPVLVADEGALPRLFDWEPARVDPRSAAALATRIERALTDPDFGAELRAHSRQRAQAHSWEAVAQKAISALSGLERRPGRRRPAMHLKWRRRFALVGSFDTRSMPGAFNTRLAQALSTEAVVDAFGSSGHPEADESAGVRRWPLAAFGRVLDASDFDTVVYVVADDDAHAPILQAHLTAAGTLLLLNDSLVRAYAGIARRYGPATMSASLARCYLGDARPIPHAVSDMAASVVDDHGLRMLGEAVRSADHVLVLDLAAADMIDADLGVAQGPRVTLLPVPCPEGDRGGGEPWHRAGVLMAGRIGRVTDALPALAAVAQVPALRSADLWVTTMGDPDVCDGVSRAARHLGLQRPHTLPELGLAELRLTLRQARAAVHLAPRPRSEPLLLAEARAAGAPMITASSTAAVGPCALVEMLEFLTDDKNWMSAHIAALEHAPSTKMEEVADALITAVGCRR